MSLKKFLPFACLLFVGLTACQDKQLRQWVGAEPPSQAPPSDNTVHEWHKKVFRAICRLEAAANIPTTDRMCPNGPGDPTGAPPRPPPWE